MYNSTLNAVLTVLDHSCVLLQSSHPMRVAGAEDPAQEPNFVVTDYFNDEMRNNNFVCVDNVANQVCVRVFCAALCQITANCHLCSFTSYWELVRGKGSPTGSWFFIWLGLAGNLLTFISVSVGRWGFSGIYTRCLWLMDIGADYSDFLKSK